MVDRTKPLPVYGRNLIRNPWPFKDYDYIGNRYVNIQDETHLCGEIMWYERTDIEPFNTTAPTECLICIEAENEMFSAHAHPKAYVEAHSQATHIAENMAIKEKETEEYIEYYTFYYGREYRKIYTELYKKYKEEYYNILLEKTYTKDDKICNYHCESIQYRGELKKEKEELPDPTSEYDCNGYRPSY
jgi:hypothetical protein